MGALRRLGVLDAATLTAALDDPDWRVRRRAAELAADAAPVALVGAEAAPGLGPEGEILQARRVAVRLANRLRS